MCCLSWYEIDGCVVEILGALSKEKVLIMHGYPLNDACIQEDVTLETLVKSYVSFLAIQMD